MRKHIAWYTKNMPNSSEFRNEINKIEDKKKLIKTVKNYFWVKNNLNNDMDSSKNHVEICDENNK